MLITLVFGADIGVDYTARLYLPAAVRRHTSAICHTANLLNGDWRREEVTHYCSGCCPPGGEADRVVRACLDLIAPPPINQRLLHCTGGGSNCLRTLGG